MAVDRVNTKNNRHYKLLIKIFAISMSLYHLYSIITGAFEPYFYRFTHLAFALVLGYLLLALKKDGSCQYSSFIMAFFAISLYFYFFKNYSRLIMLIPGLHVLTLWDKIMGILLIFLILEGTRKYIGIFLSMVAMFFLLYIFLAPYLPGMLNYKGLSFSYVTHYLVYTLEGIFSSPIASSSTYIILFLIFGSFLSISGVGDYFIELATLITGGSRGGSAKIALLSSALVGTIVGSPSANVAITGTFTIPLMKQNGFKADFAAAVEAAASTGGMILPPVMGSVAFVMADMIGVSYSQIARASLIPAILYFVSILFMIDFYAAKNNLIGLSRNNRPPVLKTLKNSYNLFPVLAIIIMLVKGFSPIFAGLFGIVSCLLIGILNIKNRQIFIKILEALEKASINAVQIILACAVSGIIIGAISLTGLSGKITSMILKLSGGIEILVLFFVMLIAIILGMGLTITPVYIMASVLGGPALISLGFTPIAAHLFILYFAVFAPLTPPLAITSYIAANLAGGNMVKTALNALSIASIGFLTPYIFIYIMNYYY